VIFFTAPPPFALRAQGKRPAVALRMYGNHDEEHWLPQPFTGWRRIVVVRRVALVTGMPQGVRPATALRDLDVSSASASAPLSPRSLAVRFGIGRALHMHGDGRAAGSEISGCAVGGPDALGFAG
jgi:hypothetical protein